MLNGEVWLGRRVLVTGHTGFKGAWLSLLLTTLGAEVTGFSLPTEPDPGAWSALQPALAHDRRGDLREPQQVREIVDAADPELVFHLGAQAIVGIGYRDPAATFATNVMGTVHLLDAVRQHGGIRAVVVATTDKVYRNDDSGAAFREQDELGAVDAYAGSKVCVEHVVAAARWYAGADIAPRAATIRAGNVIGGGDRGTGRLVPEVIAALRRGARPALRDPQAIRPWQFIADVAIGYAALAERMLTAADAPEALNLGPDPGSTIRVEELVQALQTAWSPDAATGLPLGSSFKSRRSFPEQRRLSIDPSLAARTLGWTAATPLEMAIRSTVEWERAPERARRALSEAQLEAAVRRISQRSVPPSCGPSVYPTDAATTYRLDRGERDR